MKMRCHSLADLQKQVVVSFGALLLSQVKCMVAGGDWHWKMGPGQPWEVAIVLEDEVCAIFGWLAKWPTCGMDTIPYTVQLLTSSQCYFNSGCLLESPRELLKIMMSRSHPGLITLNSPVSVFFKVPQWIATCTQV